jgi:DNA ligase 1
MSEKLDGVRAYWNGQKLISRHSKEILYPNWFTQELTNIALDGELWLGKGTLNIMVGIVSSGSENSLWKSVKYMIFDLPHSNKPYYSRMEELNELKKEFPSHIKVIDMKRCNGYEHLMKSLEIITNNGGEGLMLNEPSSLYINGHTDKLLKVKVFKI